MTSEVRTTSASRPQTESGYPHDDLAGLAGGARGFGAFDFEEFAGAHVVEESVDWNGFWDERMIAERRYSAASTIRISRSAPLPRSFSAA